MISLRRAMSTLQRHPRSLPDYLTSFPENGPILRKLFEKKGISLSLFQTHLIDAVDTLANTEEGKQVGIDDKVYRTVSHTEMYNLIGNYLGNLVNNAYVNKRGVNSRIIVGAKGIGKTTVLSNFVTLAPIFFPQVIPIYITFNNIGVQGGPLTMTHLSTVISNLLAKHGVYHNPRLDDSVMAKNLHALTNSRRYMLLMVDDIDQLYRQGRNIDLYHSNIAELAYLGNQESGRVITFLCGSSAALPQLIANGSFDRDEFPLVKGSTSLNSDKYKTFHVHTNLPTEWTHISSILPGLSTSNPEHVKYLRTIAFITGGTPGKVAQIATGLKMGDILPHMNEEKGYKILNDPIKSAFWDRVTSKLLDKNAQLFDKLAAMGKLSVETIGQIAWEEEFRPLSGHEVRQIVEEMKIDSKLITQTGGNVKCDPLTLVHHFCDRSWLAYKGVRDSFPDKIYPNSLLMHAQMHYSRNSLLFM